MLNRMFISRKLPLYLCLIGLIGGCDLGNEKLQFSSFSNGWPQHEEVQFRFTPEKINSPTNLFCICETMMIIHLPISTWSPRSKIPLEKNWLIHFHTPWLHPVVSGSEKACWFKKVSYGLRRPTIFVLLVSTDWQSNPLCDTMNRRSRSMSWKGLLMWGLV